MLAIDDEALHNILRLTLAALSFLDVDHVDWDFFLQPALGV